MMVTMAFASPGGAPWLTVTVTAKDGSEIEGVAFIDEPRSSVTMMLSTPCTGFFALPCPVVGIGVSGGPSNSVVSLEVDQKLTATVNVGSQLLTLVLRWTALPIANPTFIVVVAPGARGPRTRVFSSTISGS